MKINRSQLMRGSISDLSKRSQLLI